MPGAAKRAVAKKTTGKSHCYSEYLTHPTLAISAIIEAFRQRSLRYHIFSFADACCSSDETEHGWHAVNPFGVLSKPHRETDQRERVPGRRLIFD